MDGAVTLTARDAWMMSRARRVSELDLVVMRRLARIDSPVLDLVLPRLSQLADYGSLWIAVAAALWLTGGREARRAAWRGLGSLLLASATANLLGKALVARHRPVATGIPAARRLSRVPRKSSFPSGHAANAAAFATGVALEMPALAAPAGLLCGAVAASRVATGAHYPSDVMAGLATGSAAGLLTQRWWPRRPSVPAAAVRPPRQAPAAPVGAGLALLVNRSAGTTSSRLIRQLRAELPDATIMTGETGDDLPAVLQRAAHAARILGVAGGDGTVNLAAGIALDFGLPLLVIPAGTFNHFAADLGIRSAGDAVAAVQAGEAVLVDVGVAGQRSFVNTASTGAYADLVRAREQLEGTLSRRLASVVALIQVLRRARPHELVLDGRARRLWLFFAGNCVYEPRGMAPAYRPDMSDGYLDVRLVEAAPLARCRLVAAVMTATLGRCRVYHAWQSRSAQISPHDGLPIWLSVDGEAATAEPGLCLGKRPHGLLVYRSADLVAGPRTSRSDG